MRLKTYAKQYERLKQEGQKHNKNPPRKVHRKQISKTTTTADRNKVTKR